MRDYVVAAVFLAFYSLLAAQQAPPPGGNAAPSGPVLAPNGPGVAFQFTKIDNDVLAEANAVDARYEKKGLVMQDPGLQKYLDTVGAQVLANRPVPENVTFRFRAVRDPMVNAFALPNGSVYVTTGLLALLENEAQLAGVLGHETGHVFERHSYLENRSERKKALTLNIIQIVAAAAPVGPNLSTGMQVFGAAVMAGADISSIVLVASVYGYSREMERQADGDGLAAMTASGYDPHAMARSFELLDQDSKLEFEPFDSFYHDHPKLKDRQAAAAEFASAHTPADARVGGEKEYLAAVSPAIVYDISMNMECRRARTAVARAGRMTAMFPDDPKYQTLLGDAYRALGAKAATPSEEELTHHGQAEHRKVYFKMTEPEEEKVLLEKPEGQAELQNHREKAEQLLLSVVKTHPDYAPAYRDLGFLYEDESRYPDAAGQYHHYLDLVAATSLDHLRIERRLAEVEKLPVPQTH